MKYFIKEMEERFFIGIEVEGGIPFDDLTKAGKLWDTFLTEDIKLLSNVNHLNKFIGLECYAPDVMEIKKFDYYAMTETNGKVKCDGFSTKKLPKGKYIFFEIEFDNIRNDIQAVYKFIKEQDIKVHMGFDFEDYLQNQDYTKEGAMLNFAMLLEDD